MLQFYNIFGSFAQNAGVYMAGTFAQPILLHYHFYNQIPIKILYIPEHINDFCTISTFYYNIFAIIRTFKICKQDGGTDADQQIIIYPNNNNDRASTVIIKQSLNDLQQIYAILFTFFSKFSTI